MATVDPRGVVFFVLIVWSGSFATLVLLVPLLLLMFINKQLFRYLVDQCIAFYIAYVVGLIEVMYGTRVVITGDPISPTVPSLMVLNHRTRLDWMFYWACLYRHGYQNVVQSKICMKHRLKAALTLGWASQFGSFLFIRRKLNLDRVHIQNTLNYFNSVGTKPHLIFFPEGINQDASGIERSRKFAVEHNLPEYQHVLHPHTAGFAFTVNELKQVYGDMILYDVTIAYADNVPAREMDLLQGRFPHQVHYHIKSYNVSDLPRTNEGLQQFCREIWQQKEERLQKFFTSPRSQRSFDGRTSGDLNFQLMPFLYIALVFWTIFSIYIFYFLVSSYFFMFYIVFAVSTIYYIHVKYDGIDVLQLNL